MTAHHDPHDSTHRLMRAFLDFRTLAFRHHHPGELGKTEVSLLMALERHPHGRNLGVRASELARLLDSSPPTVTQSANSLMRIGYIARNPDPMDRRVVLIRLTDEGLAHIAEKKRHFYEFCTRLQAHLGEEDSLVLANLLSKTAQFMQNDPTRTGKEHRL